MLIDITSWELTKELQKLSGWEPDANNKLAQQVGFSLGYLLRKLPAFIYSKQYEQNAYLWMRKDPDVYCAWYKVTDIKYGEDITSEHGAVTDAPENSLCQLAIVLFKQGILTKEGAS